MQNNYSKSETAVFAGGCFWCAEAIFKMLRGVRSVTPGYTGGISENPTYKRVAGGETGHAESVKIEYDPSLISYRDLLTVFFGSHDPTTKNRQGNDIGTQYRSAIFYTNPGQKKEAKEFVAKLNASSKEGPSIVTEIAPLERFHKAEDYHRDYYDTHPGDMYCELVINPKLEKVQKEFSGLLKRPKS